MSNNNSTPTKSKFQNFAILTVQAVKNAWLNQAGTFAALQTRLLVADTDGKLSLSMPVVVKAFKTGLINLLKPVQAGQQFTVKGELKFETRTDVRSGGEVQEYVLVAYTIEAHDPTQKPSAYFKVTAHCCEPEMRYSASGNPWTRVRAFVSMGKAQSGSYRDPLWLSIKAFANRESGDEQLPVDIASLPKGAVATFAGRLVWEEYQRQDQSVGTSLNLIANKLEPFGVMPEAQGEVVAEEEGFVVVGL
jgi:hypothetical protein